MRFHIIPKDELIGRPEPMSAYLHIDNWNDHSFVTMFSLSVSIIKNELIYIGNVKIGFWGQITEIHTHSIISPHFDKLARRFFSLGTDTDYYIMLSHLPNDAGQAILTALNDIAYNPQIYERAKTEAVFKKSLSRDISISTIKGQFTRILQGRAPLTDFKFSYRKPKTDNTAGTELNFDVEASSTPSTNIHTIIGRNGIGKTTILNGMIEAVTKPDQSNSDFYDTSDFLDTPIGKNYFSSLVSVSFSAFDPFEPPTEQPDPSKGTCYFYIGLKNTDPSAIHPLKTAKDLHKEFVGSLVVCFSQPSKRERWRNAIKSLESDENFSEINLSQLVNLSDSELRTAAHSLIETMSSGHAIVLLTITKLVARVEEKTLVLIDEPESHLHPPLLSAFIRSLSELLHDRNGVAIVATHSPVVLQEIPKICVWMINRIGMEMNCRRPDEETFGENVGVLTREVFGLEVERSGFHKLLIESVKSGRPYDTIIADYNHQLGYEARAILKTLIIQRDKGIA